MKKALPNTKVTVKLRRSNYKEEWYLICLLYTSDAADEL